MVYNIQKLKDVNPSLADQLRALCFDINGLCYQVHTELGPFLNEYIYQEALEVLLQENHINHQKEFYFSIPFHGKVLQHKHYVDFRINDKIFIECKAIEHVGAEQRQQLWNYMRLTNTPIGILFNFAPTKAECEHYYLDPVTKMLYLF